MTLSGSQLKQDNMQETQLVLFNRRSLQDNHRLDQLIHALPALSDSIVSTKIPSLNDLEIKIKQYKETDREDELWKQLDTICQVNHLLL